MGLNRIVLDSEQNQDESAKELLYNIYRYSGQNVYFQRSATGVRGKIYAIVNYIHLHYNERLSPRVLAEKFYINQYYLAHCFKEMIGFTVGEYIKVTRLRNAQYLLDFTGRKITDIAEASGFSSFSQFNRSFWQVNNVSPSEYRRRQQAHNTEVVDMIDASVR